TAEELIGTNAYGPADEHLGAIGDVILSEDGKTVEAVIIDFGGFLGIGTKPVAVSIDNVRFAANANGDKYLFINVTRDQLDKAVAYNKDTYLTDRDAQLLKTGALS
ncbi:MAG: Hydrogenase maturation factor, partial [Devosia sp.]|uniref:PRC-barrel domain-containing protein n=1 Tax=Devosia sp. TaxID=1871048 RepID=UPI002632558A